EGWLKDPIVVVLSAINLANIYSEYYPSSYMDSVEDNLNMALRISRNSGEKSSEVSTDQAISRLYQKTGDLNKAEKFLLKAKKSTDSLDPINYYASKNIYHSLAQLKEKQGDYTQALAYHKTFFDYYKHILD